MRDVRNLQNHPNDTNIGGQWNTIEAELSNNYKRSSFYTLVERKTNKILLHNIYKKNLF